MPVTVLSQASSYNPGSDLWIVPEIDNSRATQKLDWYLNFQLNKFLRHPSALMSTKLYDVLEKCEIPVEHYQTKAPRYMIGSEKLLPNRWVLSLGGSSDFSTWVEEISKIWTELGKPSLRVFLPTGLSAGEFRSLWSRIQTFDDFTVVVD